MYQIKCDNNILYDPRDEELILQSPKCSLGSNNVGSASFTILPTHPYFHKLQKLKSIIEIKQDNDIIFRGRMTADSQNINNILAVDVEGALGFANDSIIPPFNFPDEFPEVATAENVVAFLLGWVLDQHNSQVETWQQLKLGKVTVADPNNYITRSSTEYTSTWDTLKSKFFESSLGGHLTIRHEDDGNYVDYVDKFELTNTQRIVFGENMADIVKDSDATQTYSAIFPQGKDGLTIADLPDGDLTNDVVKKGIFIYSKSAVEQYGWICMPVSESKWTDVTLASNLQTKAVEQLTAESVKLSSTITFKAVDLHFSDEEIQSFKPYRNVLADSPLHGVTGAAYELTNLDIDILNPQNTTITIGISARTMNDINQKHHSDTIERVQTAEKDIAENRTEVSEVKDQVLTQSTQLVNTAEDITAKALKEFVETGEFHDLKEYTESELKLVPGKISASFVESKELIDEVDGDLQKIVEKLEKHFEFTVDGLTIKAGESAMQLTIDNDIIIFKIGDREFGKWDGVNFHTGNIYIDVEKKAQFGNFAFVPRSNGSLSFLKVGG